MKIRTASPADAAGIARVHVESWRTTYPGLLPDEVLANLSYAHRAEYWRGVLSSGTSSALIYVAEDEDEEIVGFASGGVERSGQMGYEGELYAIYLLERVQRQGLGQRMVLAFTQGLLNAGYNSMLVWVLATNPARKFYERLGGGKVAEKETPMGGVPMVEVAYGWKNLRELVEILEAPDE